MSACLLHRAPSSLQPIFGGGSGAQKDRLYSETEVAAALDNYLASNSLQARVMEQLCAFAQCSGAPLHHERPILLQSINFCCGGAFAVLATAVIGA